MTIEEWIRRTGETVQTDPFDLNEEQAASVELRLLEHSTGVKRDAVPI